MTTTTALPAVDHQPWTARDDLRRLCTTEVPLSPPADGQVLLRIERLALTANNVTYGAFGDAMRYWDFFPTGDAAWGRLPAWGFATVAASAVDALPAGTRVYGYVPIGRWLTVTPGRVDAQGFSDAAPHRAALHAVYNRYQRCDADPQWRPDREDLIAVLRPLFTTSLLIDDFLADEGFFGASNVVLSSASSKTAWAAAWCLSRRPEVTLTGLTSERNRAFVERLGLYHRVVPYDAIGELPDEPSVYVDFSGSAELRRSVHGRFGERLAYSCAVGATDWSHAGGVGAEPLPGPRPQLFWAPGRIARRSQDWGRDGLARRLDEANQAFLSAVQASDPPWLRIEAARGEAAIAAAYRRLVDGELPADTALVLDMGDEPPA